LSEVKYEEKWKNEGLNEGVSGKADQFEPHKFTTLKFVPP